MSIEDSKKRLREEHKRQRENLPLAERARMDARISEKAGACRVFRDAEVVLTYLSFGVEADTRGLIELALREGKTVAVPRCVPGARLMTWHRFAFESELEDARFGGEEPVFSEETLVDPLDRRGGRAVALVPGLAFDLQGYRLGYGGGYYDRFLAEFPGVSIGLCRSAFLWEDLRAAGVVSAHDLPVDIVITD